MDREKHPMIPDIPNIDPTDNSEAPTDDAAPVCHTAGSDTAPDKGPRKRTHRAGKRKGKKSKKPTGANDQPEDRELKAIPEEEEREEINTGQSKPTEGSTGDQSTGQSTTGETIRGKRPWSAGELDEREDCERIIKARKLVKTAWDALDKLARMIDEEEVLNRVDGRFIYGT